MAGFEELIAWQKAGGLAKEIYQLPSAGELARDFGLKDYIRRAAVSIMCNLMQLRSRTNYKSR